MAEIGRAATDSVTNAQREKHMRQRHQHRMNLRGTWRAKPMATVKCVLGKRGYPSHEWNDGMKDRIYCLGRIDRMTDDPLPECRACPDYVDKAEDDRDEWFRRRNDV